MKVTILAIMLLAGLYSVTSAVAQDTQPTPAPAAAPAPVAPPEPPKKFWLEVDAGDLEAISKAIMELPKRVADPLILKLNAQLQAQAKIAENKDGAEKTKKGKK